MGSEITRGQSVSLTAGDLGDRNWIEIGLSRANLVSPLSARFLFAKEKLLNHVHSSDRAVNWEESHIVHMAKASEAEGSLDPGRSFEHNYWPIAITI